MPPVVKPVFTLIKPVIDSSQRRYQAAKANGRKGGRPRKNQSENQFINQSDNQDIDLDSDLEIDSDMDCERESEREIVSGGEETESGFKPYVPPSEDAFEKLRQEKMSTLLSCF